MKKANKIKVTLDATIRESLKVISEGNLQIAIVVNKKGKLLGTFKRIGYK